MYLLEMMLPHYIRIIDRYIKNKHYNFLTRAVAPNEVHLAETKKALAEKLLITLNKLNNTYIDDGIQELRDGMEENSEVVATRSNSAPLSEQENTSRSGNSMPSPGHAAGYAPSHGSLQSSVLSFRGRNNTNEFWRNKRSNSEGSGLPSFGTYEGVYNTGDTVTTYNTIGVLEEELKNQLKECEKAEEQHGHHKPGSYDAILKTMLQHICFLKIRTQQMLTIYHLKEYSPKQDQEIFNATYRDNLYKMIHVFLSICAFDRYLCVADLATYAQKCQYAISDNQFFMRNLPVVTDVENKLLDMANDIFSPDYAQVQQFLKTLSDYRIVHKLMQKIPAIAQVFDAQMQELSADLKQNFEEEFPFMKTNGKIEALVQNFINKKCTVQKFSLNAAQPCFENDEFSGVSNSPYPNISRI